MLDKAHPSVEETLDQVARTAGRKRRRRLLAAGLILLATGGGIVWGLQGRSPAIAYQTQAVRQGDLVVTVTATGNLEATNQVEVGSEMSGIITSMTADYNDSVEAGQPLAYLDDAKYRAAVLKSRAELAAARANYQEEVATRKVDDLKVQRYRRTRSLTQGKMPSLEDLEQAEADFERAQAAVAAAAAAIDSAKANLQADEADLKKTVIYAPISGIVLSRDVEPGQTVAASLEAPVLYTLAEDLRHMELQVDVDEADVGQVKEGQAATFTVDAYPDRTFTAQITQVRYGAETTDDVVTYKAVLSVENPDLLLRPGMTATADIVVLKIENTLLVPNAALRFSPTPAAGDSQSSGGLLNALLPRPPSHRASANHGDPAAEAAGARVWALEAGRPKPVTVKKIATDGALTAVASPELQAGSALIVNAVAGER